MSGTDLINQAAPRARLGNIITVLMPARSYSIGCAWTTEKPLPAVELFACRLLLILDQILPSELQGYFGLTDREREVLVEDLLEHRLVIINPHGYLEASSFLRSQSKGHDEVPMLVQYEERSEQVVFELLSMSVRARKNLSPSMFGLPEIPLPDGIKKISSDDVTESFSKQYRSYLELARRKEHEIKRSKLYKIMGCELKNNLQIPIEIQFSFEGGASGEPKKHIHAIEKVSAASRRPLSHELEAKISDFLGSLDIGTKGISAIEYCSLFNDSTLEKYASDYGFDYSRWLSDRDAHKTGYGSPSTTGIFGPLYLPKNRANIIELVKNGLRDAGAPVIRKALWYSSDVPLWGANSEDLSEFTRKLEDSLSFGSEERAVLTVIHSGIDKGDSIRAKQRLGGKFRQGVMACDNAPFDRVEILLIPGLIATVQYHGQPNFGSALTVPLGYVTTDEDRVGLIESVLSKRLRLASKLEISWASRKLSLNDLVPNNLLSAPKIKYEATSPKTGDGVDVRAKPKDRSVLKLKK